MSKAILIVSVTALLAIGMPVGAQTADEVSDRGVTSANPSAVVSESLEEVRRNIGGWCGTPDLEAHYRVTELGKPAVRHLIQALKGNDLPEIDRFIAGTLSTICCYTFDGSSHDSLLVEIEEWWRIHRNQREQEWILDGLASGDSRRTSSARQQGFKLASKRDIARLVSFLRAEDRDGAWDALYILWRSFKSEHALSYIREVCRNGTKDEKVRVLRFCGKERIQSLSPTVAEVLRTDKDRQVVVAALQCAKLMRAADCIPEIEEMDRNPSPNYPMADVIGALAALKTTAYGDRVLYYLQSGDHSERAAAASVVSECVAPQNAITPLIVALNDADLNVRRCACRSLGRAASDKTMRHRLGDAVPTLIQLLLGEDESDLGRLAHEALKQICTAHFGQEAVPNVDSSLGGSRFSQHALPIWEDWWTRYGG